MLTIGSLFSGIGGLELGLERAGLGPVVWQVEQSAYCRSVLARHWPDAERFDDVRSVGAGNLAPVDLICGGFPCQDLSHAGKRKGLAGERSGLWREFLRIASELRPSWVVIENVHHAWAGWVPFVRRDLHAAGYASVPLRMSAGELGADHRRTRAFVIANPDGEQLRELSRRWRGARREVSAEPLFASWGTAESRMARVDDGIPRGVDRRRALGNAVVPACAEVVGHVIRGIHERSSS